MRILFFLFMSLMVTANDSTQSGLSISAPELNRQVALIEGLVNPLSGTLSLQSTDLIAKGAESIALTRFLSSYQSLVPIHQKKKHKDEWDSYVLFMHLKRNYKDWQVFPHISLQFFPEKCCVRVPDSNGMVLEFKIFPATGKSILNGELFGITNFAQESPGGMHDPRNTEVKFKDNKCFVRAPDGTQRIYINAKSFQISQKYFLFSLEKEILPNGKVLRYFYENNELVKVESTSPDETIVYATLTVSKLLGEKVYQTSTGLKAQYEYEILPIMLNFSDKTIEVCLDSQFPPRLKAVKSPFFKGEVIDYTKDFFLTKHVGKEKTFSCSHKNGRVEKLFFPSSDTDEMTLNCEINYSPPVAGVSTGWTQVKNNDGTVVVYSFLKNLLINSIKTFDSNGDLQLEKRFKWTKNQWLDRVQVLDEKGKVLLETGYVYDAFGNPIEEQRLGFGKVQRVFSQDGRHLLLRESHENGKIMIYDYLPQTNLLTTKHIFDKEILLIRERFIYDQHNNLLEHIVDDGINERKRTRFHLKQEPPFLHLPEVISVLAKDHLIQRTHLIYDSWGNICQESVFGSNSEYAYTLEKLFDEEGNLLSETNPLGQKTTYGYDENSRPILETTKEGNTITKTYDLMGRLTKESFLGFDGINREWLFQYNSQGDLIEKKDHLGRVTRISYDPLSHKPIRIEKPPTFEGVPVVEEVSYDCLGRKTSFINPNGQKTRFFYGDNGYLSRVLYPNGSEEHFTYDLSGRLVVYKDQENLKMTYIYDVLDRLISKTYGDSLASETFNYGPFDLISKTDREGRKTSYVYNALGQLTEEFYGERRTSYDYDFLGRKSCKTVHNNPALTVHYQWDLLDHLVSETVLGLSEFKFSYDQAGNETERTCLIQGAPSTEFKQYDSLNRQILFKDPHSIQIITSYEDFPSQLKKTHLPNGTTTCETFDNYNRIIKREVIDKEDTLLFCKEYELDPCGAPLLEVDHIYKNGVFLKKQTQKFTYEFNTLKHVIREAGRKISFTRTLGGKIKTKTFPNGVTLYYDYDDLGYLKEVSSSDLSVHNCYQRNCLGELTSATDEVNGIFIKRELDAFGNVIQETLPGCVTLLKSFDLLGRKKSITFPDGSSIQYVYNPLRLIGLNRISSSGKLLYTHETQYDMSGLRVSDKMIGNLGQVQYSYDLKGRCVTSSHPYLLEERSYDDFDQLKELKENRKATQFEYDALSQLVQENSRLSTYDSNYNRLTHLGQEASVNELNELISQGDLKYEYDLNGRLISKQGAEGVFKYRYNALDQLIQVETKTQTIQFSYDPLGRRFKKRVLRQNPYEEISLWDEFEEIGSWTLLGLKNLKVLLGDLPIAVEIGGVAFAPLVDLQNNIRGLIDLKTKKLFSSTSYTAFGESAVPSFPFAFAVKRFDAECGLSYFGSRYYDAKLARWLTPDPAGFMDGTNLYQYAWNNPFKYKDPYGENVLGFLVGVGEIALGGALIIGSGYVEVCSCGLFSFGVSITASSGLALMTHGASHVAYHSQDINFRGINIGYPTNPLFGASGYYLNSAITLNRKKEGSIDPSLPENPDDLLNNGKWTETTHPDAKAEGHRRFENNENGETLRHDAAKPEKHGHQAHDHYHRLKPNGKGGFDNIDGSGNVVPNKSEESHIYSPSKVWWKL